jgi:beta-phosphoglucomutase-like phosphatase (HAD superfamily)
MIKAFLFDLDGTLQDTEVLYVEAWRRAYQEKGCTVSLAEAQQMVYGRAKHDVYAAFRARFSAAYPTLDDLEAPLLRHFLALRGTRNVRIEGSIALLGRLAQRWPVAVVSGNARQDVAEAVEFLGLGAKLAFCLGCEDYWPGKPHPACFRLAAERLKLPPEECLVFEDSAAGVEAAKRAGMRCVALLRRGAPRQDLSQADLVLEDLSDFDLNLKSPLPPGEG